MEWNSNEKSNRRISNLILCCMVFSKVHARFRWFLPYILGLDYVLFSLADILLGTSREEVFRFPKCATCNDSCSYFIVCRLCRDLVQSDSRDQLARELFDSSLLHSAPSDRCYWRASIGSTKKTRPKMSNGLRLHNAIQPPQRLGQ